MKVQLPVRQAIIDRKTYEPPGEGRANKLRLDFNENTAGCSPAVPLALGKLSPKTISMYPEYERGARRLARYYKIDLAELMLTNGGDDALRVFIDAFVNAGERIVVCEPTFPMYRYWGEVAGARIDVLRYSANMEFPLDAAIQAASERPRVLFICNPNNPTGTQISPSAIETILKQATHTAVVIDEAYAEFAPEVSVVKLIHKYPQLFVARTFSKVAGLASLRLGAVIAHRDSLTMLRRATAPFPVNLAALVAAVAAVNDRKTMSGYLRDIARTREWFEKELHTLGVEKYPSQCNFLLTRFGPGGPALFERLARDGVMLRDRAKDIGPGVARISIGTQSEMERLMKKIKRYWKK
jgi:histidinol-phosphate aminotransferase